MTSYLSSLKKTHSDFYLGRDEAAETGLHWEVSLDVSLKTPYR